MTTTDIKIRVAGLRVGFQRAGSGPPVVFLHGGFGFDSRSWGPQLEALADEFTVVAWDAPGAGRSSDPPVDFRMAEYADCLASFIAALSLDRPHIVGLSWGAALAIQLYGRHPAIPRTLVLAGAYAGWAGSLPADITEQRLRRLLDELKRPSAEWARAYIPGLLTEAAPKEMVDSVFALMCDARPAGSRVMLHAMAEADLRDVLPRIEVPALLLYGDADVRSSLDVGRALHAQIPTSTLVVLPGAGHLSNVEAADRFNAEVRAFLRRHT
jgi:pimeloyl-ACP methyl ester carboxylesterase